MLGFVRVSRRLAGSAPRLQDSRRECMQRDMKVKVALEDEDT